MAESFILEQELNTNPFTSKQIDKRLEIARQIQNSVLGELLKRHRQMIRTKEHQKCYKQLSAVLKKLSKIENKKDRISKEEIKYLKQDLLGIYQSLYDLRMEFGLTKYHAEKYGHPVRHHFQNLLDADAGAKASQRAWISYEKYLIKQSKKISFKKVGEVNSIEGKSNKQGIRFVQNQIFLTKTLSIPITLKPCDMYANEILFDIENGIRHVKYCRMIRKTIRGKKRYFVQLVLNGNPPIKRNAKTGEFKRKLGIGPVGIDIGTQSVAIVGEKDVLLKDLSPNTNAFGRTLWLLDRKMDRSRRSSNPQNYHENGTIKKGKKTWYYSNRYKKLREKRKELFRRQTVIRKQSHNADTNLILSFGDIFYVETMNFKGLQKRSVKTEKNEKGTYKKKKRFGKSIGNKAPSLFLTLLKQKLKTLDGNSQEINTQTFKASQYDHMKDDFAKKKLSQRWHIFDNGITIQRDLYSGFLLMNSKKNGKTTDRKKCLKTFDEFKILHDEQINKIKKDGITVKNSGINCKF